MEQLPQKVSLIMRCFNEAWALPGTLRALNEQDYPGEIELIVVDSGSTDGSRDILQTYQPAHLVVLEPGTYVPGRALNQGFKLASHEWVVLLSSDAQPADTRWLSTLLKTAMQTPQLGVAFCRQIPRPDCKPIFVHDYDRCFGPNRESARWEHFFSLVSCALKKSVWLQHPFREDLQFAEDDEWSRRLKKHQLHIVFAEQSIVVHSHNYTPQQARIRTRGDSTAMAQAGNVPDVRRSWFNDVLIPALRDTWLDWLYFRQQKLPAELTRTFRIRYNQRLGRLEGYRAGLRKYRLYHGTQVE